MPDVWTCNVMISGFCKQGRIDEALRLNEEMEKLKLLPDVVIYNTLINGCFEHGSSEEGFKLINGCFEALRCLYNTVTCNALISGHCKVAKMDEAFRLMEEMGTKCIVDEGS